MSRVFPVFLKLEGRRVLVAGAGAVAERKIQDLVDAGAKVQVVAPEATPSVRDLAARGLVTWASRRFEEADVEGAWLVIAATTDDDAQARAAAACEARQLFLIAVDDLANASAYSGSVIRRPPFLVALSSSAEAPALTRLLREVIEQALPDARWVEAARALRRQWKASGAPMGSRFAELVRAFKIEADREAKPPP